MISGENHINKNGISILVCVFICIAVISTYNGYAVYRDILKPYLKQYSDVSTLRNEINKCEKSLPRDKRCKVIVTIVPE